jgi:NADPH:quinone reductase-like Zn-dependent oxidoreductase
MDSSVTLPVPEKITLAQASTIGAGAYTAGLGVFYGLQIPLPDLDTPPSEKDEWVLVLGGASSVGKFTIQVGCRIIITRA